MAHPKRKHSRSRGRKRRTHQKTKAPLLVECNQCRRDKPAHMICPFCGYYGGKEIVKVRPKTKKEKR